MHWTLKASLITVVTLGAAVACGGNSFDSNGTGGSGGGGAGGTGGSGTGGSSASGGSGGSGGSVVPPQCRVADDTDGPHQTEFRFINNGAYPVFVKEDCSLNFSVASCADDYSGALAITGNCTIECGEGDCIACGACQSLVHKLETGESKSGQWYGSTYTFDETKAGCPCHYQRTAPNGKYRVSIPVYSDEDAAWMGGDTAFVAEAEFDLPAAGGVVEIDITPPQEF